MQINLKKILLTGTALVAVATTANTAHAQVVYQSVFSNETWGVPGSRFTANVNVSIETNRTLTVTNNGTNNDGSGLHTFNLGNVWMFDLGGVLNIVSGSANDLTVNVIGIENFDTGLYEGASNRPTVPRLIIDNSARNTANSLTVNLSSNVVAALPGIRNEVLDATIKAGSHAGATAALNFSGSVLNLHKVTLDDGNGSSASINLLGNKAQMLWGFIDGSSAGNGTLNIKGPVAGSSSIYAEIGQKFALKEVNIADDGSVDVTKSVAANKISVGNNSTLTLYGANQTLKGAIDNAGTINAGGSQITFDGAINNTGTINASSNRATFIGAIDNAGVINAQSQSVTFDGTIANSGTLNIGSATARSNTTFADAVTGAGASKVNVAKGSILNIGNNLNADTNEFAGTLNVYAAPTIADVMVASATKFLIDGALNSNLNNPVGTAAGTSKVLTLVGPEITVGSAQNTAISTANTIKVSGGTMKLGHLTDARTVTLSVGRGAFWDATANATQTGKLDGLDVLHMGGNALTFANSMGNFGDAINNKLVISLADSGGYSFDHNDVVDVVVNNDSMGLGIRFFDASKGLNPNVVLQNTALMHLNYLNSDGTYLANNEYDLTVRVRYFDAHSVMLDRNAANAANVVLGQNNLTGVLGLGKTNVAKEATVAGATKVAQSLTSTVDGGASSGAHNATNGSFNATSSQLAELRTGQTGMAAGNGAGHRFWAQAFGATADQDRRSGIDGYDADTYGFVAGVDTELSSGGILGLALSYANTDVDSKNANSTKSEIDTYQITLYGSYDLDQSTFVNGMLAYSWHDVDTTRHNVGGTGFNANGSYDADQFSAQATIGRDYLYDSMTLTPSLLAHWTRYSADDYTETGAGNASLRVNQSAVNKFELGAGVSAAWDYQTASGSDVVPELHAGYRYDFIGDEVSATNRFIGGGAAFNVKGADPSKHSFNVGGSLSLYSTNNWEFSANYDYDFKSDYDAHSGFVRAGFKF